MNEESSYNWKDSAIREMVRRSHQPVEVKRESGLQIRCEECGAMWPCSSIAEYRSKKKWWWVLVD